MINRAWIAILLLQGFIAGSALASWPLQPPNTPFGDYRGVFRGDFNDDGKADVLLRNEDDGRWYMQLLDGKAVIGRGFVEATPNMDWFIEAVSDFDGDGKDDLLLRNYELNRWYLYLMDGLVIKSQGFMPLVNNLDWGFWHAGDLDGDNRDDLVLRSYSTGRWYAYLVNGRIIKEQGFLPVTNQFDWGYSWLTDLNGDGRSDLVIRNRRTGRWYGHLMNGLSASGRGYINLTTGLAWSDVYIGDLEGDGKEDLLLRNAETGRWYAYLMEGLGIRRKGFLPATGNPDWMFVSLEDFSGDGRDDLLLRHRETGRWYAYVLNGVGIPRQGFLDITANVNWEAVSLASDSSASGAQLLLRLYQEGPAIDQSWFNLTLSGVEVSESGFAGLLDSLGWQPSSSLTAANDQFDEWGLDWPGWLAADEDGDRAADYRDTFPDLPFEWLDSDGDGVGDNADQFPDDPDEQFDGDSDSIGDHGDNCPLEPNQDQADGNQDGVGDACSIETSTVPYFSLDAPLVSGADGSRRVTSHIDSALRLHLAWTEEYAPGGVYRMRHCRFDSDGIFRDCDITFTDGWDRVTGLDMVVDGNDTAHLAFTARLSDVSTGGDAGASALIYGRFAADESNFGAYVHVNGTEPTGNEIGDYGTRTNALIAVDQDNAPGIAYVGARNELTQNQVFMMGGVSLDGGANWTLQPFFNQDEALAALEPVGETKLLGSYDASKFIGPEGQVYFSNTEAISDTPVFTGWDTVAQAFSPLTAIEGYNTPSDEENRMVQILSTGLGFDVLVWFHEEFPGPSSLVFEIVDEGGVHVPLFEVSLIHEPSGAHLPCTIDQTSGEFVCLMQVDGAEPTTYLIHDRDGDGIFVEEFFGLTGHVGVISGTQSLQLHGGYLTFVGVNGPGQLSVTRAQIYETPF